MKSLRIATRQSPLALCQAALVKKNILNHFPELTITLVPLSTSGDKKLTEKEAMNKNLFTKEIEEALLADEADIAVHSMKDMPVECTPNLVLAACLKREDPRDVFVSSNYSRLDDLPKDGNIGTASLRRQCMVKFLRQDVSVSVLRGNVNTRLLKLEAGHYDALILAAAGLHRLGLSHYIQQYFSLTESLPAAGQGIIGIQCREKDREIQKILKKINHDDSWQCLTAERALNSALGGSCRAPIGAHAVISGKIISISGCVYSSNQENKCLRSEIQGPFQDSAQLGEQVAKELRSRGADKLLAEWRI